MSTFDPGAVAIINGTTTDGTGLMYAATGAANGHPVPAVTIRATTIESRNKLAALVGAAVLDDLVGGAVAAPGGTRVLIAVGNPT